VHFSPLDGSTESNPVGDFTVAPSRLFSEMARPSHATLIAMSAVPAPRPPAKAVPMPPPGVPVRAGHAKGGHLPPNLPTQDQHQQQQHRQMQQPYPSPRTRPPPLHKHGKPSPALTGSDEGSLKESTRVNIGRPSRQETGDTLKSPKDLVLETPREQYVAQVHVHDDLESRFDDLLVSSQATALILGFSSSTRLHSAEIQCRFTRRQTFHPYILTRIQPDHPLLSRLAHSLQTNSQGEETPLHAATP
jgi:hypothetical protein